MAQFQLYLREIQITCENKNFFQKTKFAPICELTWNWFDSLGE
jgi:hypothetical protein